MDQWQWLNDLRTLLDPPHAKLCIGSRGFFGLIPLYLSLRRFNTHMYVVGASDQGKSKFLQHILYELTTKGHGCGVFDPHSDLASDLLAQLAAYPSKKCGYPIHKITAVYSIWIPHEPIISCPATSSRMRQAHPMKLPRMWWSLFAACGR
jgi:hypothetical protein